MSVLGLSAVLALALMRAQEPKPRPSQAVEFGAQTRPRGPEATFAAGLGGGGGGRVWPGTLTPQEIQAAQRHSGAANTILTTIFGMASAFDRAHGRYADDLQDAKEEAGEDLWRDAEWPSKAVPTLRESAGHLYVVLSTIDAAIERKLEDTEPSDPARGQLLADQGLVRTAMQKVHMSPEGRGEGVQRSLFESPLLRPEDLMKAASTPACADSEFA